MCCVKDDLITENVKKSFQGSAKRIFWKILEIEYGELKSISYPHEWKFGRNVGNKYRREYHNCLEFGIHVFLSHKDALNFLDKAKKENPFERYVIVPVVCDINNLRGAGIASIFKHRDFETAVFTEVELLPYGE